jgi:hypothetical protein
MMRKTDEDPDPEYGVLEDTLPEDEQEEKESAAQRRRRRRRCYPAKP